MISVAMATYNGEKYIREQLDSILNQIPVENHSLEIVICDDCSIDSTNIILRGYCEQNDNIRYFRNESNLGYVKNFEKAISLCNGDYIALADQDDIWFPNHIQVLYMGIQGSNVSANSTKLHYYDVCGANAILVDEWNKEIGSTLLESFNVTDLPDTQLDYRFKIEYGNIFQGAAMMISKRLAKKVIPFPEGISFHDYWLIYYAFILYKFYGETPVCGGVNYIDEPILRYRQHNSNVTENSKYNFWSKVNRVFCEMLGKNEFAKKQYLRRKNDLEILKNVLTSSNNKEYLVEIDNAIWLYNSWLKGFPYSLITLPFFCKNYYRMYRNSSKRLFVFRLVKRIFGIL